VEFYTAGCLPGVDVIPPLAAAITRRVSKFARVFGIALHDRVTNSFGLVVRAALRPAHSPVHCHFGLIVEEEGSFLKDASLLLHSPLPLSRASAVVMMSLDDVSLLLHLPALLR
jgi:hypothetical protein